MAELWSARPGWSYPSWRPGFYPAGLANEGFLAFYSARLPSVELNSTGYRLPSEEQFERWAAQVPDGFRFAVKMPPRALRSLGTFEERVRRLGDRLGPVRVVVETPARRRTARAAARLDRHAARARPPRRELGRRRGRSGGARERLGGGRAVSVPPLPRAALLRGGARGAGGADQAAARGGHRRVRLLPARGRADAPGYARGCSSSSAGRR